MRICSAPLARFAPLALCAGLLGPVELGAVEDAAVVEHYAAIVEASYQDSIIEARRLRAAIHDFLAEPTPEGLVAAKAAWLQAREPYGQTEVYRFYGGPIDDEDGPEGLINAWPLDEAYIDRVAYADGSGIIGAVDEYPELSAELLRDLNERLGDANISTGYHAIEFLLWGQDFNDEDPLSAGQRPVSDYTTAEHAERRGRYLELVADMLIDDLESVHAEWRSSDESYRREVFQAAPQRALGDIIVGIGSLAGGELAGERMAVALANKDQEDEHSCFSDNTHRDIVLNAEGVANVWQGRYRRIDGSVLRGPGLRAAVVEADAGLAARIDSALAEVLVAVAAIQPPFDRELVSDDGRARIQAAIEALWRFTRLLPEAAAALGVEAQLEGL